MMPKFITLHERENFNVVMIDVSRIIGFVEIGHCQTEVVLNDVFPLRAEKNVYRITVFECVSEIKHLLKGL